MLVDGTTRWPLCTHVAWLSTLYFCTNCRNTLKRPFSKKDSSGVRPASMAVAGSLYILLDTRPIMLFSVLTVKATPAERKSR